jgi:hypothetical protein
MVTRLRALQSAVVPDPTRKSASYVPAQPALLFSLRSTDEGRGIFPGRTLLANPVAKRYVNPRELGFVPPTPIVVFPRITIDATTTNFSTGGNVVYTFSGLPPATSFEATIINGVSVGSIKTVSIYDAAAVQRNLMGSTTIDITPVWTGSAFTSDANAPTLENASGGFPTTNTVLTFRSVPLISEIAISLDGAAP